MSSQAMVPTEVQVAVVGQEGETDCPTANTRPPSPLSFSTPELQHLVGATVKMPFDAYVLLRRVDSPYYLLDLRNGTTRYFSGPEIAARSMQPALLNNAFLDSALTPGTLASLACRLKVYQ